MEPKHDFRGMHFSWPCFELSDFVKLKGFPASWEEVILRKNSYCTRISHRNAPFLVTLNWTFSSFSFFTLEDILLFLPSLFPPHHSTLAQFLPLSFALYEFVLFHHSCTQDFLCSGHLLVSDIIHFHNNSMVSIPRILPWLHNLFLIANTRHGIAVIFCSKIYQFYSCQWGLLLLFRMHTE